MIRYCLHFIIIFQYLKREVMVKIEISKIELVNNSISFQMNVCTSIYFIHFYKIILL